MDQNGLVYIMNSNWFVIAKDAQGNYLLPGLPGRDDEKGDDEKGDDEAQHKKKNTWKLDAGVLKVSAKSCEQKFKCELIITDVTED